MFLHGFQYVDAAGAAVFFVVLGAEDKEGRCVGAYGQFRTQCSAWPFVKVGGIDEQGKVGPW